MVLMKSKKPKPLLIQCPSCAATGFIDFEGRPMLCGRCGGRGWLIAALLGRGLK